MREVIHRAEDRHAVDAAGVRRQAVGQLVGFPRNMLDRHLRRSKKPENVLPEEGYRPRWGRPASNGTCNDARLSSPKKMTTLNPNAAEFVPSARRYLPGNNKKLDGTKLEVPGTSRKAMLDQSVANVSSNSDEEAHQYWCHQLPDDITPDFKGIREELQAPSGLSFAGLSMNGATAASRWPLTMGSHPLGIHQERMPLGVEYTTLNQRIGCSGISYTKDDSSIACMNLSTTPLDWQFRKVDRHLTNDTESHYDGNLPSGFLEGFLSEHGVLEDAVVYPEEFLALKFPGFRAESLAEMYYANGCDMNLTIEILTQSPKMNTKVSTAPSPRLDFPALSLPDFQNKLSKYNGEGLLQTTNAFQHVDKDGLFLFKSVPSNESMGTTIFPSAVHRLASRSSEHWKHRNNGTADASSGPIINSQLSVSSHVGPGKTAFADKLRGIGTALASSSWLETGDQMAQLYSEMRDDSHDAAHLQNACFVQANTHMVGNKAFTQEHGVNGQLYDIQMKEAQEKTRESGLIQRNPISQIHSYNQAQDPLIDLHGLHVNEAIHVLKHELNILRRTARSAGRRLQVMIRVSAGPHARGSRNLVRLPIAVQQYLLDEKFQFSEDQPGLLRLVIC